MKAMTTTGRISPSSMAATPRVQLASIPSKRDRCRFAGAAILQTCRVTNILFHQLGEGGPDRLGAGAVAFHRQVGIAFEADRIGHDLRASVVARSATSVGDGPGRHVDRALERL